MLLVQSGWISFCCQTFDCYDIRYTSYAILPGCSCCLLTTIQNFNFIDIFKHFSGSLHFYEMLNLKKSVLLY